MTRNFETFVLALVAALAMSTMATPPIQASVPSFAWAPKTTWLTAEAQPTDPSNTFETLGDTPLATCNKMIGKVDISDSERSEITINITYTDTGLAQAINACTGPFGTKSSVSSNGCDYRFTPGTKIGNPANRMNNGTMDIMCPLRSEMEITAPGCVTRIPEQVGVGPVVFRTITANGVKSILVEAEINHVDGNPANKGIRYSTNGVLCGTHTNETNGSLTGKITLKGSTANGVQTNARII